MQMNINIWNDCKKNPSELGKKVLCQREGDFYVATRIEEYYIPLPFADHYFCKVLCYPETWTEIHFPEPYTGYIRAMPIGCDEMLDLSELKRIFPETYWQFVRPIIDSIGKIPRPKGMQE